MSGFKIDGALFAEAEYSISEVGPLLQCDVTIPSLYDYYSEAQAIIDRINTLKGEADSLKGMISEAAISISKIDTSFYDTYSDNYNKLSTDSQNIAKLGLSMYAYGGSLLNNYLDDTSFIRVVEGMLSSGKDIPKDLEESYIDMKRKEYYSTEYQHTTSVGNTSFSGKGKIIPDNINSFVKDFNENHNNSLYQKGDKYKQGSNYQTPIAINVTKGGNYRLSGRDFGDKDSGTYGMVALGYAEGNANAYAGAGYEAFGVGGSAGGKVSVVHVDGSATAAYKTKNGATIIGCGAQGTVDGLSANGNITAGAGIYRGNDGLLHTDLGVGASAEANIISASGKVHATVAGVKATVGAGVKVGVGAHANVGVLDGKLKVDIGAAVGVGLDINFAVDVSGVTKFFGV